MIKKDVGVKVGQIWRDHWGAQDNDPTSPIEKRRHVKVINVGTRLCKYGHSERYAEIINCSPRGIVPIGRPRVTKAKIDRFGKSGGYALVHEVAPA